MAYNDNSKIEDKFAQNTSLIVLKYLIDTVKLPKGYKFKHEKKYGYKDMFNFYKFYDYPDDALSFLTKKNNDGEYASIMPDGGVICITDGETKWPILILEAKHQESDVGNAIERLFKNYNCITDMFSNLEINPYIVVANGKGTLDAFIQNKVLGGAGFYSKIEDVKNYENLSIYKHKFNAYFGEEMSKGGLFYFGEKWDKYAVENACIKHVIESCEYMINNNFGKNK